MKFISIPLSCVALLWWSCGTVMKVPDAGKELVLCAPSNCTGCCTTRNECLSGTSQIECGSAGSLCVSCAGNQFCGTGTCQKFDGGDYDASFPDLPDASVRDAGVFDAGTPIDSGVIDAGIVDAGPASFANDVMTVLNSKCGNCHNFSYANLVNTNSTGSCNAFKRVVPGDAGVSSLYTKLVNPMCGSAMPTVGSISATEISIIRRWIAEGALNN